MIAAAAELVALLISALFAAFRGLQPLPHHLPHPNELSFHQLLTLRLIESGPLSWIPHWGGGAAVLRYFPHFSHSLCAVVASALRFFSPLTAVDDSVVIVNALFLFLLPWAIAFSCRRLGLGKLASAGCGVAFLFVRSDPTLKLTGLQLSTYTWDGTGAMTQLVGLVFGMVALGIAGPFVAFGRSNLWVASLTLSCTWLSSFQIGYGMTVLLVPFVFFGASWAAVRRLLLLILCVGAATSYVWTAAIVERAVITRSHAEPAEYWASFGIEAGARMLLSGRLLDHRDQSSEAIPWLAVIMVAGLAWSVVRFGSALLRGRAFDATSCLVGALFGTSALLFCGRPLLGKFVNLLPFGRTLVPFSGFFVLFQVMAAIVIAWFVGECVSAFVRLSTSWDPASRRPLKVLVVLVCVGGLFAATAPGLYSEARDVGEKLNEQHFDLSSWWGRPLSELLNATSERVAAFPGRAYAGASWNWGQSFDIKFVKLYSLWTGRGLSVPSIGQFWHSLSLMSELDVLFDERRADHRQLFNVRYIICQTGRLPDPYVSVSEEKVGHSVHEWTSATGYFDIVQVVGCHDAWNQSDSEFLAWRKEYVLGVEAHWNKRHPRVALSYSDRCQTYETLDKVLGEGVITGQKGNMDEFEATIGCAEPLGCSVLVRISYHPNFVVSAASTGATLQTFCVAPAYMAFVVPFGVETYRVVYRTPLWSSALFVSCYVFLGALAIISTCGFSRKYKQA